ncbi:carbonyl reductase [NADPH] 3-like isoform X2 [Aricia agestis]|uniref:carbonyl reductase [NADPH] 3-like isoform X2 n=1 Tax=Aricia agestis TaxID=91739 RepID=UPI001C2080CB|nr:carbonyl reductase [NADPH] 3-like isoform X2 [Aricia agestis]
MRLSFRAKFIMNSGIAVVTGANKGLGYSTVKQLCKKYKGTVYLTSRDEKRGIEAFEKLKTSSDNLYYYQLDVSDENSIKDFCKHLEKERKTIDILVNNAGVLFLKDSKEPKLYQAEQTVLINFFALVNFTEAVLPFINDNATIVNISSSSGHLSRVSDSLRSRISDQNLSLDGLKDLMKEYIDDVKLNKEDVDKDWGESPYVISKVAVNAYTFQLNRRLQNRGIRVNCVHPGYVISDMTRGGGKVTPDLAAELVVTVAMETAGGVYVWSNGQRVPWDGADPRGYIDNSAKVV